MNTSGLVFVTVNKLKSPGKFIPVYKTETTSKQGGSFEFAVTIDTDTMCDDNPDQEIMFQVFSYQESGKHKKIGQGISSAGQMK